MNLYINTDEQHMEAEFTLFSVNLKAYAYALLMAAVRPVTFRQ
jgi:hypothetical protein